MKAFNNTTLASAMAILLALTGAIAFADEPAPTTAAVQPHQQPQIPHQAPPAIPAPEPIDGAMATTDFEAKSGTLSPEASTLSPPVTLSYSGSSNAFTVTDSGTGRGISSTVTNTNSGSSAMVGSTVGTGAGLTGLNSGTSGPGGKFEVSNANSAQAGAFASTNGTGPAMLATVTNTNSNYPAIYGQSTASGNDTGVGVRGDGGDIGVIGNGYVGVEAIGNNGSGVSATSTNGNGVFGYSTNGTGVYGGSTNNYGVYGESSTTYAGYFAGSVAAESYVTVSDKNAKTNFKSVNNHEVLDKVSRLPITSWDFKTDKKQLRHLGPMAQDFQAEFGLNGDDDKHINLGDMAGITLAAVQELSKQMKEKNAQIAELAAQNKSMVEQLSQMRAAMLELRADRMVASGRQ